MLRRRLLLAGFFCYLLFVVNQTIAGTYATSPFSGLVVSQGESTSGGAKVVEIYPGSPAEKAGLSVGDIILEIDGQKVKTLEEFVNISKAMKEKSTEAKLLLIRKGRLQNALLFTYSENVFKEWKEKVAPPPESDIGGLSLFQYYLEKGRQDPVRRKQAGRIVPDPTIPR